MFVTAIHARMKDHASPMEIHFPVLASLVLVETNAKLVSLKCVSNNLFSSLSLKESGVNFAKVRRLGIS